MSNCPVCNDEATSHSPGGLDGEVVYCPRCGQYQISRTAAVNWRSSRSSGGRLVANASGWIREHQNELIDSKTIERFLKLPTPSYDERKHKLLRWLELNSRCLGDLFDITEEAIRKPLHSATYSEDFLELNFLKEAAYSEGLIDYAGHSATYLGDPRSIFLSAKGYDFLSQLNKNPDSQIGFCAMWFHESMDSLFDSAIKPAIRDAGYQELRIDKKEHLNRIDDEIFADIRRSRFVVADFTHGENGVRGGVYFEAGFAQGLGLPVIWTCREDMLSEDKLHFDIRQYNFLEWSESETGLADFKKRLQKRIEAILGRGTWKSDA